MDSIRPFIDKMKLYVFKKRNRAKLTIKINDDTAVTYLWNIPELESMLKNWENDWNGKAMGTSIFVGPKRVDKDQLMTNSNKMVRISAMGPFGMEHRVTVEEMNKLKDTFFHQMENDMPWD
jgi:hypothetical protein